MKNIKRLLVVVVILSMICSVMIFTSSCAKKEKKAIILIHGIMGGALYDADSNEAVWALDSINSSEILSFLGTVPTMMTDMALDENGVSVENLRVANMTDERGKYTMLSMFEPLYTSIQAEYGEDYDVKLWQYDWRLDNLQSAAKLEQFIAENDYDKVIFVTHSMGGNVVSQYLANSEANKEKVELFIPISTPFLGSAAAYYFILDGMFPNVGNLMTSIPTGTGREDFSSIYNNFSGMVDSLKPMFLEFGKNIPSVYMLSPFAEYSNDPEYATGVTALQLNGVSQTHSEAAAYFSSLSIAKKADNTLKPGFALYEDYQTGHMVLVDGVYKHISNTVNTQYIASHGVATLLSINVNSTNNSIIKSDDVNTTWGDGVVSTYSATAGNSRDAANVHIVEGSNHVSITTDEATLNAVTEILADFIKK